MDTGGKKLRTVPLMRSEILWPFISLLRRFDKGHEHLRLYLPLQPTDIVLQDTISKRRKQIFTTSDLTSCRKGKVSLHDFPKKGQSTMSHIP